MNKYFDMICKIPVVVLVILAGTLGIVVHVAEFVVTVAILISMIGSVVVLSAMVVAWAWNLIT